MKPTALFVGMLLAGPEVPARAGEPVEAIAAKVRAREVAFAKTPFSWQPERVEVVSSGTLALSTGPVFDPEGHRMGTFNSTWRLEKDGEWRVVLDNGCPPCPCP